MEIGKFLKEKRESLGLSQEDIASACGVNRATVSRWESGNIANMRRDRIERLAAILQISPAVIVGTKTVISVDYGSGYAPLTEPFIGAGGFPPEVIELIEKAMSSTPESIKAAGAVLDALNGRK